MVHMGPLLRWLPFKHGGDRQRGINMEYGVGKIPANAAAKSDYKVSGKFQLTTFNDCTPS